MPADFAVLLQPVVRSLLLVSIPAAQCSLQKLSQFLLAAGHAAGGDLIVEQLGDFAFAGAGAGHAVDVEALLKLGFNRRAGQCLLESVFAE